MDVSDAVVVRTLLNTRSHTHTHTRIEDLLLCRKVGKEEEKPLSFKYFESLSVVVVVVVEEVKTAVRCCHNNVS